MKFNPRSLVGIAVGAVVLVVIGVVGKKYLPKLEGPKVGDNLEMTDEVKSKFDELGVIGLTSDSDKISLEPVRGENGSAMATREWTGGTFIHSVIAQLADPGGEAFYEGWLVKSEGDYIYTGRLEGKKGGWVLEYVGKRDLNDYPLVVITREKIDDQRPEAHVLEGEFREGGVKK